MIIALAVVFAQKLQDVDSADSTNNDKNKTISTTQQNIDNITRQSTYYQTFFENAGYDDELVLYAKYTINDFTTT